MHRPEKLSSHCKGFVESEFENFRLVQDKLFESDFDKAVNKIEAPKPKKK